MTTPKPPSPPSTLPARGPGRELWKAVTSAYVVGPGEVQLLEAACIAWEAHQAAAAVVAAEGVVVTSPQGVKAHPAIGVMDRCGTALGRHLRQLGVSLPEEDQQKLKGGGGRPAVVRLPRSA